MIIHSSLSIDLTFYRFDNHWCVYWFYWTMNLSRIVICSAYLLTVFLCCCIIVGCIAVISIIYTTKLCGWCSWSQWKGWEYRRCWCIKLYWGIWSWICLCISSCQCMHFFSNDETVGEHVNIIIEILSYISEILNTLLQMIDETFYKTLAYMCLQ